MGDIGFWVWKLNQTRTVIDSQEYKNAIAKKDKSIIILNKTYDE